MSANSAIKRIDINEFREQGFLQEANRQFFHPHGLALEVTIVDADGWSADNPRVQTMGAAIMARHYGILVDVEEDERQDMVTETTALAVAAMNALYPPGSMHLSGCWDYRDDPEGVIFGDGADGKAAHAERVATQREKHAATRARLFDAPTDEPIVPDTLEPPDVEPIDWVYIEDGEA